MHLIFISMQRFNLIYFFHVSSSLRQVHLKMLLYKITIPLYIMKIVDRNLKVAVIRLIYNEFPSVDTIHVIA